LNSYIETQTIDFAKLTERGLFGIFGPTGCGKSTILDAIILSLYGHKGQKGIPRSTNEFINTAVEQASISYMFGLDTEEGARLVQVERKFKRTNTGLSTSFSRLQIMTEDQEVLEVWDKTTDVSNQVVELLGLTREDFMRSVVLPQGKFSEFLTLEGKDRRDMLERLLNLKAYGSALQFRIKRRGDLVKEKMLQMEGEMKRYADVTPEAHDQVKKELEDVKEQEAELQNKFLDLEKEKSESERLYKIINTLKNNKIELLKLEEQVAEMSLEKNTLKRAQVALSIWPYHTQFTESEKTLKSIEAQLTGLESDFNQALKSYESHKELREIFLKTFDKNKEQLLLRKSSIEKAKEHKSEADALAKTRQSLLISYKTLKNEHSEQVELIDTKAKLLEKNAVEIQKLEADRLTFTVKNEKREDVLKGLKLEESHKKYSAELDLLRGQVQKKTENLNVEKESNTQTVIELELIQADIKILSDKMSVQGNKLQDLPIQISKAENERYQKNMERSVFADKMKVKADHQKKQGQLLEKMLVVNEKGVQLGLELKQAQKTMEKAESDRFVYWKEAVLATLSDQLNDQDACPLCGSHAHPHVHEKTKVEDVNNLAEIESVYREVRLSVEQNDHEKKHLQAQIDEVKLKLEDLSVISESALLEFDKSIRSIDDTIKTLKVEYKNVQEDNEKSKHKYDNFMLKAENLKQVKQEGQTTITKLETQRSSQNEHILQLEAELKIIEDQLPLENNEYIYQTQYEEIKEMDKKLASAEVDLEKLRNEDKINRETLEVLTKTSHEKEIEMKTIVEKGSGLKDRIESHLSEVTKAVGSDELEEVYHKISNDLDLLLEKNTTSKDALELAEKTYRSLESQVESLKAKRVLAHNNFEDSKEKLHKAINQSELESVESLLTAYLERDVLSERLKVLSEFEESLNILKDRVSELEKERSNRNLSEEDYLKIVEQHKHLKLDLDQIKENRARLSEKLKSIEKDLKQLEDTLLRYKKYQNAQDLVKDLLDLVKGNKFVEYVAVSHLKYIALDASRRLMDITNHRYSLELDVKGNFIICDHYNGGVKRDTKTLSGGETFLTALSLSLALSSQIQLKGRTNLEFFFLDEGFGTLDSELLDIVMTSLEKLFHEKLTVGIISHVDELKNRVPIKLTVEPAQAGVHGTKTKIEVT